ncbi:regulatory protein RecX [Microlunatus soli]|uniref:Regulatory protein RecX n=1 Tax=Microlunatus soli TaxID=630515 RepID=A0A1H1ZMY0_9ACTN|nr:regulatory protein RecX [Microlunatus soli]SDT34586.1 regulatory protein [Microlunatus soli]
MTDLERRRQIAQEALRQAEQLARRPKASRSDRPTGPSQSAAEPDERDSRGRRAAVRRRAPSSTAPGAERDLGSDAEPESAAREIVLRKLTAQARSRSELAKALAQKDVPDDAASAVLDRMEDVGLVDDAAFAETWVRNRQERRYLSKRALRQELMRKGVQRDDIDNALAQVEPDDEYEAATALAQKKARAMSGLDREVKYRRLAGALGRRGFGPGITSRVLAEVLDGD